MKRILIAGAGSYLGTTFERYIGQWPEAYSVETIRLRGDDWRKTDFSAFDVVYQVAGIAHQKETAENAQTYYEVNCDLAAAVAEQAKAAGVGQFVYLSSMSVYGMDTGVITRETPPVPTSHYGKSKLLAEERLRHLADDSFRIAILRPPMVYGKDCPGNFQTVIKLVKRLPIFPRVCNRRSMIYVENLCAFVKLVIDRKLDGCYFPQNREYAETTQIARLAAKSLGKRVWFSFLAGAGVLLLRPCSSKLRKAFGSLTYQDMEDFDFVYCAVGFEDSIRRSV